MLRLAVSWLGLLLLPLLVAGIIADRALARQARREREAEAIAAARSWSQSVEAALSGLERSVAAGRPVSSVTSWRLAQLPDPSPHSVALPYAQRPRSELAALLNSYDATPSGLPEAVVAKIALGEARRSRSGGVPVVERLLSGRLPVRPDDLPSLAEVLGVAANPEVALLEARLRAAPDADALPPLPRFSRQLTSRSEIEGWTRTSFERLGYRLPVSALLELAGLEEQVSLSSSAAATAVPAVRGLRLAGAAQPWRGPEALPSRIALWTAIVASAIGLIIVRRALLAESRALARERAFLASVSHELRTPLASMRLLGETLAEGRGDPRDYGSLVAQEAERLHTHVEQVLAATRVDETPRFVPTNPEEIVSAAVAVIRPRAERSAITLACHVEELLPEALWDREGVRRALLSLLDNALVHGRGPIEIRAWLDGDVIKLSVADAGPGIGGGKDRKAIFGRFQRGPTDSPGVGLGLFLVDQVARAHGGRVELETGRESGATFTLALPLQPPVREPGPT